MALKIPKIKTDNIIESFKQVQDLKIGGEYINGDNLNIVTDERQFQNLKIDSGCYFIFTTLPENRVFSFNDYKCFNKKITKNKKKFGCIYNGKGKDIRSRMRSHMLNPQSKSRVEAGEAHRLPTTGAMSLETITQEEIDNFVELGVVIEEPKYSYLKQSKLLSEKNRKPIDHPSLLYNGINVLEPKWKPHQFGVVIIETDNKMGMLLIEQAFRDINGRPPLCVVE